MLGSKTKPGAEPMLMVVVTVFPFGSIEAGSDPASPNACSDTHQYTVRVMHVYCQWTVEVKQHFVRLVIVCPLGCCDGCCFARSFDQHRNEAGTE